MADTVIATSDRLLPDDVEQLLVDIDGWLGPHEGRLLYRLAAGADPRGCIVEIGSWHGRSTTWLAAGAKSGRNARIVAIDPHEGTHLRAEGKSTEVTLRKNLESADLADRVEIVVATSAQVAADWSRPVSLLWIDGDHEYESVRSDLELWDPYLMPDATVALHDTFVSPGPERAVRELMIETRRYTSFVHAETTTAARRCDELPPVAALARRLGLLRRLTYSLRLRAYDTNRYGFATLRDLLARR